MTHSPSPSAGTERLASFGIVMGGALWGLYWWPIRHLQGLGLEGAWPGMAIFLAVGVLVAPVVAVRWRRGIRQPGALAIAGLCVGGAFTCYSAAVTMTDVARAILLFYLTPVWGTLLGVLLLGERLSWSRVIAIVLAFCGLIVVTGTGTTRAFGLGDALALTSGVAWAFGTLVVHRLPQVHVADLISSFGFGSLVVCGGLILLSDGSLGPVPDPAIAVRALLPALAVALYLLPVLWLTIWPAQILTPGRTGLLLMSEVIVSLITAALFAGDPFGLRETAGAVLIVSAAFVEVLGRGQSRSPVR